MKLTEEEFDFQTAKEEQPLTSSTKADEGTHMEDGQDEYTISPTPLVDELELNEPYTWEEELNDLYPSENKDVEEIEPYGDESKSEKENFTPSPIDEAPNNNKINNQSTEHVDEQKSSSESQKKRKHKGNIKLSNWLNGNILRPFLNWRIVSVFLLIALLFFLNIYLGFLRINKIGKLDRLEKQLRQIEYKQLFITGEISKLDREETILENLKKSGSTLIPDNDPPYVIYYNGQDLEKQRKKNKGK